jgi:YD repeat-containing protein
VAGANLLAGAAVILWDCGSAWNYLWLPQHDGSLLSPQAYRCLDIAGSVYTDGTAVQSNLCTYVGDGHGGWNLSPNQVWQAHLDGTLTNPASGGKCLNLVGSGTANGTLLELRTCTATVTPSEVFTPQLNSTNATLNGTLLNPGSGRCLDASSTPNSLIRVFIWDCNGLLAQQWVDQVVDADGSAGFTRQSARYDGSTLITAATHTATTSVTATRSAPLTGDQNLMSVMLTDTSDYTQSWLPVSSTWRWTETDTAYNSYALPTMVTDLGDVSSTTQAACTTITYVSPDTTNWFIDYPAQSITTDCVSTPGDADYLRGSQTFYDGSTTDGATPTQGLPTKTTALALVSGGVFTWAQASRAAYDTQGRVTTAYDALNRSTGTAYTPATGGPVTQTTTTNPMGWTSTTTLDPGKGSLLTQTDPNGKVTTLAYDALGRLTQVWLNNRPTSANPDQQYTYTLSNTAANYVQTQLLNPSGNQISSYTIYDGLMRERQIQVPTPVANGGRWSRTSPTTAVA